MKKTLDILFEDQWLVAIDKPSGLMSVAGNRQGVETAYSLVNDYIVHKYNGRKRAHVMHRLDRDTSGILLFAKDFQTKRAMTDNWNGNIRERRYVAVLDGIPREGLRAGSLRMTGILWCILRLWTTEGNMRSPTTRCSSPTGHIHWWLSILKPAARIR